MNRREALKQIALLTGGALSLSTVSAVLNGCTSSKTDSFSPRTLSSDQNEMVTVISEHIIPKTDTPGAADVGVNEFIDKMLTDWNYEDERKHFLEGLDHVDEVSNSGYSKNFMDLGHDQQVEVLKSLEQEAKDKSDADDDLKPFFTMMKEYTITGYYTSEVGASKELRVEAIPGYYDGDVPYDKIGRAWAAQF